MQKSLLIAISFGTSLPGALWGWIYAANGEPKVALLPFGYSFLGVCVFLLYTKFPHRYREFYSIIRLMILIIPFLIFMTLGGFYLSSAVIVWSLTAPFTSLLAQGGKHAIKWFIAFIGLLIFGTFMSPITNENEFSAFVIQLFFFANFLGMSLITFAMIYYTVSERARLTELLAVEKLRSEELLLNVLPIEVIPHLQNSEEPYMQEFDSVSVMFADVVGFTQLTEKMGARKMLDILNKIFSHFDSLLLEHKAEKIRTIGDNYMVAVGAPVHETDHAFLLVSMAKKMLQFIETDEIKTAEINFRIGINSGPVVAGVIGKHKFHFDIWGDIVNIASRLETHGIPSEIQIGAETYRLLGDRIKCEKRGEIEVKGKGKIETWLVV